MSATVPAAAVRALAEAPPCTVSATVPAVVTVRPAVIPEASIDVNAVLPVFVSVRCALPVITSEVADVATSVKICVLVFATTFAVLSVAVMLIVSTFAAVTVPAVSAPAARVITLKTSVAGVVHALLETT